MIVPKMVQLTFGGGHAEEHAKRRGGAIGKVERLIDERPWLTCSQIAEAVQEPSCRVSECLNKLKHEGRAVAHRGLGDHRRWVWASTSEAGREEREARLREITAESDARMGELAAERLAKAFLRAGAASSEACS